MYENNPDKNVFTRVSVQCAASSLTRGGRRRDKQTNQKQVFAPRGVRGGARGRAAGAQKRKPRVFPPAAAFNPPLDQQEQLRTGFWSPATKRYGTDASCALSKLEGSGATRSSSAASARDALLCVFFNFSFVLMM